jgi:hypothetical protein
MQSQAVLSMLPHMEWDGLTIKALVGVAAVVISGVLRLASIGPAVPMNNSVPLKEAPGREAVEHNCTSCHSLDYPRTNSPFLDRRGGRLR